MILREEMYGRHSQEYLESVQQLVTWCNQVAMATDLQVAHRVKLEMIFKAKMLCQTCIEDVLRAKLLLMCSSNIGVLEKRYDFF